MSMLEKGEVFRQRGGTMVVVYHMMVCEEHIYIEFLDCRGLLLCANGLGS